MCAYLSPNETNFVHLIFYLIYMMVILYAEITNLYDKITIPSYNRMVCMFTFVCA